MSSKVDKRWMKCARNSHDYIQGVGSFIDFVKNNGGEKTLFSCPCRLCMNGRGLLPLSEISYHLLKNGVYSRYTTWRFHGESSVQVAQSTHENVTEGVGENVRAGVDENVAAWVDENVDENVTTGVDENVGTSRCCKKNKSAVASASEPLYTSCPKGKTPVYAAIKLNNIKTQYGFSENGVTALLELIKELLPEGNTLPSKFPEVKKMIQELGMDYVTYDACVNDCILYWKDKSSLLKCPVCQEHRYVKVFNDERKLTQVAQKTLRHFPIIARLKRLYSIPWIAEAMLWYYTSQKDINVMRHPVDSSAWRCADKFSPEFAKEPRNVTLGIATDGFNPNGCFGLSHSCWPVILRPYNLPPSMCMKQEFSMLCLLISGPRATGKDIDVYLQPLIDELKQLWNEGVLAFDSFTKSEFLMRARLLWSIHDFPALGTLSGCVTHGYYACPTCREETVADWLPFSKKICYMGHRRWLPSRHKHRDDKTNFNGGVEHGTAPWPLIGLEVQEMVSNIKSKQGKGKPPKKRKRGVEGDNQNGADEEVSDHSLFTRRSILYDLPNWGSNAIRHCTDVMHTEKNITEHLVNTIIGDQMQSDIPVEDPCAMTATFGKDSRGRVRSIGPISRMQVELSAHARAKVNELKAKEGSVSQRMEELGGQMEFLIEGIGILCNAVKDIQTEGATSVIGSNADIISRDVQSCSQGFVGTPPSGSHAQTNSPVGPIVSPAQSTVGGMPRCSLLNMDGEIIATGRLCTGDLGRMCHSQVVPPNLAKVVLDEILLPLQVTAKANMLVATFREVGVGGFVLHPKMCITYD